MNIQDFRSMINTKLAKETPVANLNMSTGEILNYREVAQKIIKNECLKFGFNPAALSTRWNYGNHITCF